MVSDEPQSHRSYCCAKADTATTDGPSLMPSRTDATQQKATQPNTRKRAAQVACVGQGSCLRAKYHHTAPLLTCPHPGGTCCRTAHPSVPASHAGHRQPTAAWPGMGSTPAGTAQTQANKAGGQTSAPAHRRNIMPGHMRELHQST
jgi:hypothetical protein